MSQIEKLEKQIPSPDKNEEAMTPEDWEKLTREGILEDPPLLARFLKDQLNSQHEEVGDKTLNNDPERLKAIHELLRIYKVDLTDSEIIQLLQQDSFSYGEKKEDEEDGNGNNNESNEEINKDPLRMLIDEVKHWT